jgi:predicted CXXCH cytochrome family protein
VQTVQTTRQFTLARYAACRSCHEDEYQGNQDSVHGAALRSGRSEAAVCVDCHGAHDIQSPKQPRERISLTCGKCHGAIFEQYRTSVHGAALMTENNPDVPTCIDCHGVHSIQNPTTAPFRVRSPALCSQCHANADLMAKYNISTQVFDSYLTDFHGSTVALFEQQDPTVPENKAVCYDCHGVHNIQPVGDGKAQAVRETLLNACQQCHPDATANFPDAWIGHYPATPAAHPVLTAATGLYNLLLPLSVGVFGVLIATDVYRRIRRGRTPVDTQERGQ